MISGTRGSNWKIVSYGHAISGAIWETCVSPANFHSSDLVWWNSVMGKSIRIMGIDPGSRITGYGVVEKSGSSVKHIDNGAVITSPKMPLGERLLRIHEGLSEVIARYEPETVAMETVFVSKNVSSALKLGHARGVAMLAASQNGLEVHEYAPTEVKKAVVGTGRAEKKQVQEMVRMILGLPEIAQEDASDALAVAICRCHHHNNALAEALAGAKKKGRGRR